MKNSFDNKIEGHNAYLSSPEGIEEQKKVKEEIENFNKNYKNKYKDKKKNSALKALFPFLS